MNNNKCIYCLTSKAALTESHIIPDSLGGSVVLKNAVCKKCNEKINKEIEMPIRDALALIRNMLGIKTRKRNIPSVKAISNFRDLQCSLTLTHLSRIDKELIVFKKANGKQIAYFGTEEKICEFKKRYEVKHKKVNWEDIDLPAQLPLESILDMSVFYGDAGLRLACKIGLEWFAHTRSTETVLDEEFNVLRNYVLSGRAEGMGVLASIVTNQAILKSLDNIPFGMHAVILTPTTDRKLVILFALFGVVYYKIIVQNYYSIITQRQALYLVNPQSRVLYEPEFQYKFMPITARDKDHLIEPRQAFEKISPHVLNKMNSDYKMLRELSK